MQRLLTTALVAVVIGSIQAGAQYSTTVQTTSGSLIGHQAPNRSCVTEFLGVRYAQAPVGDLRFAAPQKYIAPQGTVFEASQWVNIVQAFSSPCQFANPSSPSTYSFFRETDFSVDSKHSDCPANKPPVTAFPKLHPTVWSACMEKFCGLKITIPHQKIA